MDITEYLKYAITNRLFHKWVWATSVIGRHNQDFNNDYARLEDGAGFVIMDGEDQPYPFDNKSKSFIKISDEVLVYADSMVCLDKDITTTVGRLIINYILIEHPFNGKIKYIPNEVSLKDILKIVKDALGSETISVDQYKEFITACNFLELYNRLVTVSSTAKLLVPPPGLDKFKTELETEFVAKYGKDWNTEPSRVVDYDNRLKVFYNDYIKDDPSNGIIANDKNKNNALSKKYLTFGTANAFGDHTHIDKSLSDGYPEDPVKLAAVYNTIRAGSYSRGATTQQGGSVAKAVLRATSSIAVTIDDCGVKYGKTILVTSQNVDNLIGRYIISGSKLTEITPDNAATYVNKIIETRSPMYCINDRPNLCKVCLGSKAGEYKNGISLIVTNISSVLTLTSLKAIHDSQTSTVKIDLAEMLN